MKNVAKIGRLFGVPIQIQYNWFLLFGLFSWLLSSVYFPAQHPDFPIIINLTLGILGAIFLFISVVLHELAHSLAAKKNGLNINNITLFLFGGTAHIEGEPDTPKAELKVAVAGPLLSLLIALIFLIIHNVNIINSPGINAFLYFIFTFNLILALFNLTPAFPMDGGRILHASIWHWKKNLKKATKIVTMLSLSFAIMLIFAGIYFITILNNYLNGIWLIGIGVFLYKTAKTTFLHIITSIELKNKTVEELMTRNLKTISPETTLEEAWKLSLSMYHFEGFPVLDNNRLVGLILTNDVKHVHHKLRKQYFVKDFMLPTYKLSFAPSDLGAYQAWQNIRSKKYDRLLIIDGNQLIGILTASDLERRLSKL